MTLWTVAHQAALVHGVLQERILEWVAILFSRGSSQPGDRTWVSGIVGRFDSLPSGPPGKPHCYIFTYLFFWLCWVFIAARRLSLSGESGSYSLVVIYRLVIVRNFSCCRARTLGAWASVVATQRRQWHPTPLLSPGKGGAWWAAVHGVTKSQTRLSDFTFTFPFMHWRRKWQPTPVFLPEESQGWGSLVGCRLWGRTESDTTEVT